VVGHHKNRTAPSNGKGHPSIECNLMLCYPISRTKTKGKSGNAEGGPPSPQQRHPQRRRKGFVSGLKTARLKLRIRKYEPGGEKKNLVKALQMKSNIRNSTLTIEECRNPTPSLGRENFSNEKTENGRTQTQVGKPEIQKKSGGKKFWNETGNKVTIWQPKLGKWKRSSSKTGTVSSEA